MITSTGMALAGPSLSNWIISHADDAVRGRAVGMLTTGLFAGQFFSPVLTQPIINMAGLRPTFMGVAAASALITFGYTALARRSAQARKQIAYQS
jgi:MFS family permease